MAETGRMTAELTATPPGPVLAIENLELRRGTRVVLSSVTLEVGRGELVALMGPSGSGKTTILRAVAGLETFQGGYIDVDGVRLHAQRAGPTADNAMLARLRRKVGMVFQFHCLFEHMTAIENICLAPIHALGVTRTDANRRAIELMTAFGVEHRAQALPRELSGGEAQRVAIARALAVDPPILLMDEPTASLDPLRRGELGTLLRGLIDQRRTLVVATHDGDFAAEFATRILRTHDGTVDASR